VNTALWLIAAVASLVIFIWLAVFDSPQPDNVPSGHDATMPDLYMQQAAITQYGDDGKVRYELLAIEIRHFEADKVTQLKAPTLTLNRAPQPAWVATARQGTVEDADAAAGREELVTLRGDVRLAQPDSAQRLELTCSEMLIYPGRRFARTDQPVIITSSSGRTTAAGLSGDLDAGLLKLTSTATQRVKSVVLPAQIRWNQPGD
jgi:lipopolysaccharide export system protein LptC